MTFAPQTIKDLAALWVGEGGVNLGIVGDAPHQATGTSYHLGKDQLAASAYSATLARDRAGLTNAASAIDLGKLDGSLANLQKFSVWLVAEVRAHPAHPPVYRDVREVIYSPDGQKVLRWDNELKRLNVGGDGTGQGDNSHRYHTHISFYRDSEVRDKRALFAPYFAPEEVPMLPFIDSRAREVDLRSGTVLYDETGKAVRTLVAPATVVSPFISDAQFSAVFATVEGKQVLVRAKRADIVGPVRLTDEVEGLISAARIDAAKTAAGADDSAAEMRGRQIEWDRQNITATAKITLAPRPGP